MVNGNTLFNINPDEANDFKPSVTELAQYFDQNPLIKCLFITNPNNPTGAVFTHEEYQKLARLLQEPRYQHISVIVDEVYERTDFNEHYPFISFASLPGMFERCVTLTGVSKNLGLAKERIGIAAGPSRLIWPITMYITRTTGGVPLLSQKVVAALLSQTPQSYFEKSKRHYAEQFRWLHDRFAQMNQTLGTYFSAPGEYIRFTNDPKAGFFACIAFPGLKDKKCGDTQLEDDFALFRFILEEAHVIVLPSSLQGFGPQEMTVRINVALPQSQLEECFRRIETAILTRIR